MVQPNLNDYFVKGKEVEISSDDQGFRGSWFLGTIVGPATRTRTDSSHTNNKFIVQYLTLLADTGSGKPLRETLDLAQLRPPAPRELDRDFLFSDEVDAYHNDGWWEGVITDVLDNDRYSVFFRPTREQLDFHKSSLRLHREWKWKYGKWEPPLEEEGKEASAVNGVEDAKKMVNEEKFRKGMLVEVTSEEEGFEGAWFSATISELSEDGKLLIEYQALRNDDDTEFLREEVASDHVRPAPPDVPVERFKLHQEVDALHNDGWWIGIVLKVHDDGTYEVYFLQTNEAMVVKHLDLRVHQEWINGKWVMASQFGLESCDDKKP